MIEHIAQAISAVFHPLILPAIAFTLLVIIVFSSVHTTAISGLLVVLAY